MGGLFTGVFPCCAIPLVVVTVARLPLFMEVGMGEELLTLRKERCLVPRDNSLSSASAAAETDINDKAQRTRTRIHTFPPIFLVLVLDKFEMF